MSHNTIKVVDLHHTSPDKREALRGISFEVQQGESIGLVGANGAGKSTLLQHLVGVLMASSGSIEVGHIPVNKTTLQTIRQKVGLVFQDSDNQLFMNRVYDDVAFGPRNYNIPEDKVDDIVKESLNRMGIEHLAERAPYKLSGGEKKSAAIASVLAMSPDILVMDEPTSGLDPKSRRNLINILGSFEHTKIIATHDMDMVIDLCDRTIILKDGLVAADGPTLEIFSDAKLLEECSLEIPLRMASCPKCSKQSE